MISEAEKTTILIIGFILVSISVFGYMFPYGNYVSGSVVGISYPYRVYSLPLGAAGRTMIAVVFFAKGSGKRTTASK